MRGVERIYPYIIGGIFGLVVYLFDLKISEIRNFNSILNATITFSSIIIAFLSTMISIFISLTSSEVMQRINNEDGEGLLTSYIAETVIGGILLVVYSMVLFMYVDYNGKHSVLMLSAYVFLLCYVLLSSYRILKLTSSILKKALQENSENNKRNNKKVVKPKINTK